MGNIEKLHLTKNHSQKEIVRVIHDFLNRNYPECFIILEEKSAVNISLINDVHAFYIWKHGKTLQTKMPHFLPMVDYWILLQIWTAVALNLDNIEMVYSTNEGVDGKYKLHPERLQSFCVLYKEKPITAKLGLKVLIKLGGQPYKKIWKYAMKNVIFKK